MARKNDKQRIRAAFKEIKKDLGIEAVARFKDKDDYKPVNRRNRSKEIYWNSSYIESNFDDNGNIIDSARYGYDLYLVGTPAVDKELYPEIVKILEKHGLGTSPRGDRMIRVESHLQGEYERARYEIGYKSGFTGDNSFVSSESDVPFIAGWIAGVYDLIRNRDDNLHTHLRYIISAIRLTTEDKEYYEAVIPTLTIFQKKYIEGGDHNAGLGL